MGPRLREDDSRRALDTIKTAHHSFTAPVIADT